MPGFPIEFDDLQRWVTKGILARNLNAADGTHATSLRNSTCSLIIGVIAASVVQYLIVFLFQKDSKFGELLGLPIFSVPMVASCISFVVILMICLLIGRAGLEHGTVVALTFYILSGLIPVLVLLFHQQLIEAIRLFRDRRDPSLPYLNTATFNLLRFGQASVTSVVRAWIFFTLELLAAWWYVLLNLRRVLIAGSVTARPAIRVSAALFVAIVLNALLTRFYTGRLYWWILGRLLN